MNPTPNQRADQPVNLVPRLKVWLESDGRYAFGLGVCEMLQAIARIGSIKRAAADLSKSYRYVWGRVKAAEEALGRRLVETHIGGKHIQRSRLTPAAQQLVADFLALREAMKALLSREFERRAC